MLIKDVWRISEKGQILNRDVAEFTARRPGCAKGWDSAALGDGPGCITPPSRRNSFVSTFWSHHSM